MKAPLHIQVPQYDCTEFAPRRTKYCLCIPVLNEGEKIKNQLARAAAHGVDKLTDILLCDGGSNDGYTAPALLRSLGVRTLLVKKGSGRLSAQLRMGYWYALEQGYEGVITVDGNGKDSVESVVLFVRALEQGYDMVQGSRFIPGGKAVNTPVLRHWAVRLIHIPAISLCARFLYTDTTNGFRGYSRKYLTHPGVQPFRDVFNTYELLAYLSVRAPRLGLKTTEVPVTRTYPPKGRIPTKISMVKGNCDLLRILFEIAAGKYNP